MKFGAHLPIDLACLTLLAQLFFQKLGTGTVQLPHLLGIVESYYCY